MKKTRKLFRVQALALLALLGTLFGLGAAAGNPAPVPAPTPAAPTITAPVTTPTPAPPEPSLLPGLLARGKIELAKWNYREAERISTAALAQAAGSDVNAATKREVHHFRAEYCYYAADYACARDEMKKMAELETLDAAGQSFAARADLLAETWEGAKEARSEHFVVRYAAAKDVVLVEPALRALEKSYSVLGKDFGVWPADPVLVEVYPDFESFGAGTGLTEEDLENSGTIAVCKYRRLMINSPRILVHGYDYQDTLSHEYTHFLVYQRYAMAVPIWLHEGIAKYEEGRWRGGPGGGLSVSQKSLLASALKMNELISFDRMHPSFAKLKTPRQGQLAFAEVTTVVDYLIQKGGWPLVFKLCDELAKTPDYRRALERVTGLGFEGFWADWIRYAKGLGYEEIPGLEITAYEIQKGEAAADDEEIDESDLAGGEEWKYARLGDLLRDRKHFAAAVVEYDRARELAPYNPQILNKLGLCHFLAGQIEPSLEPLKLAQKLYPDYSTTYVNLGRSLFELKRTREAAAVFEQGLTINPFNPILYAYLIKIYEAEGEKDRARKLEADLKIISG